MRILNSILRFIAFLTLCVGDQRGIIAPACPGLTLTSGLSPLQPLNKPELGPLPGLQTFLKIWEIYHESPLTSRVDKILVKIQHQP